MDTLDKKLQGFRQIAQEKLQNILCAIPDNEKFLIIDPELIKPMEHVCGASWLRSKSIKKIFKFDGQQPPPKIATFIYFIPANFDRFKSILSQIQFILGTQTIKQEYTELKPFHIIVFPNVLYCFETTLEAEGLSGQVELHRFNWDFITIDTCVLSLEFPQLFRDIFMRSDTSLISSVAHSLKLFNIIMGRPKLFITYGEHSECLYDLITRIENYQPQRSNPKSPDFTICCLIDRSKDYPSSLLTPVVYSGLLTEVFHLKAGVLQIDAKRNKINTNKVDFIAGGTNKSMSPTTESDNLSHLRLYSVSDEIYRDNRYRHISEVVSTLTAQAKEIGVAAGNVKGMKLEEMHEYVTKQLPQLTIRKKELLKHLTACETVVTELSGDFEKLHNLQESMLLNKNRKDTLKKIDEMLACDGHKLNTLRLMCLMYVTCGYTFEDSTAFITNYCNAFGHKYLTVFHRLGEARLFPDYQISTGKSNILANLNIPKWQPGHFQNEANKLKLLPNDPGTCDSSASVNENNVCCPSYVFNNSYIPLICQLVNLLLSTISVDEFCTKTSHMDQMKLIKGDKRITTKELLAAIKKGDASEFASMWPFKPRTVFVFILGGVTYAEIAACKLLERLTNSKIVLGSNQILSGDDLINAAFQS